AWFRRRFGINNEQALDLFHQTVSLKSVGNLTDFVRSHMLEPFDVGPRITALINHFDDLNRAHEAVLKAKQQLEMLEPIAADFDILYEIQLSVEKLRSCRDALRPWFASLKVDLLDKRLLSLDNDLKRHQAAIERMEEQRGSQQEKERELRRSIAENGGDRIQSIAAEIKNKQEELERRRQRARRYNELACALGEQPAMGEEEFITQRARNKELYKEALDSENLLQNEITEKGVALSRVQNHYDELKAEIRGLKARRSNINEKQVSIRLSMGKSLNISEEEMPFIGELIQVREEEQGWEGAIERLLHGFGLSLLVPDKHYAPVAEFVDETHLKGKLVYFRVRDTGSRELSSLHPDSLVRKLQVKPDSPFCGWIERELSRRFDLACCKTQEQFQRESRAITSAGQIKIPGGQHEKDDRHRLDDRTRYILGWSNAQKIAALEERAGHHERNISALAGDISGLQKKQSSLRDRIETLSKLDEYSSFRDMDWNPLALQIAKLEHEKNGLETASDILKTLALQLTSLEKELKETEEQLDQRKDSRSKTEQKIIATNELKTQVQTLLTNISEETRSLYKDLETMREEASDNLLLTVESCDNGERDMREWLQNKIDAEDRKISRLGEKLTREMTEYRKEWPLETREVDVSLNAGHEYRAMLDKLKADDLPRFEERFKELLNVNTIREVANFQSQINRERETIRDRIARINRSLTEIDYNNGRYISLEAQMNLDADIREFQKELRTCTEGALTGSGDAQYSEAKFLQVKKIIERFRGREEYSDMDRRWTAKVTDVRNWFVFAASERWREDDSEYEHYADSGGKSGGQKEKLAYTVLAASLAYQFGLEWGAVRSRSFRFVVIDEAFGRGSDESAEYGLRLFEKLNLQLLIVTPLQKIHIIEPFVSGVGFVHSNDGRNSVLRNLTIEEYRAEKQRITG
ncbi:MAG: ATP-dependent exonuclease SbcCD, C subunit-like protein, partial [Deltaproteobacteria bacterium]|nr:ATP-dependent exonuclease SbcCD, C subunit-like protein [Deltaproteobacteria bacterium]